MVDTPSNPTAHKILQTAARLFMQRGFRAVSINDIVQAAEITKPTLYYHFTDKEEVYVQMAIQMLIDMHQRIDAVLATAVGSQARLLALSEVMLTQVEGDMRLMFREIEEHLSPQHRRRLNDAFQQHLFSPVFAVMQQGLADGTLANHSPAELTWLYLGMVSAFLQTHHNDAQFTEQFRPPPAMIVHFFLHGVGTASSEVQQA